MENALLYFDVGLFFLNYLLLYFLEKKYSRRNWAAKPGFHERWSKSAKPALGGVGFIFMFVGAIFFQWYFFPGSVNWFLVAGIAMAFALGLVDDLTGLSPLIKFSGQLVCAAIVLLGINVIPIMGIDVWDKIITLFWVVGLMNSLNMLDNMDAAASVPALGITVLFTMIAMELQPELFPLFLFMSGSIAAFLFFNWPPSKLFMGDSGSLVLGLLLAFGAIQFSWLSDYQHPSLHWYDRVGSTLLVFTIPLADTLTVTINRLAHGISPARGGRDHSTHHLVYAGVKANYLPWVLATVVLLQLGTWFLFSSQKVYTLLHLPLPPRVGRVLAPHSLPAWYIGVIFFLCYFLAVFILSRVNLSKGKYAYAK